MDLLDRLLGHDRWTTTQLLERCRELRLGLAQVLEGDVLSWEQQPHRP